MKKKRFLTILLVVSLLTGLIYGPAFAAQTDPAPGGGQEIPADELPAELFPQELTETTQADSVFAQTEGAAGEDAFSDGLLQDDTGGEDTFQADPAGADAFETADPAAESPEEDAFQTGDPAGDDGFVSGGTDEDAFQTEDPAAASSGEEEFLAEDPVEDPAGEDQVLTEDPASDPAGEDVFQGADPAAEPAGEDTFSEEDPAADPAGEDQALTEAPADAPAGDTEFVTDGSEEDAGQTEEPAAEPGQEEGFESVDPEADPAQEETVVTEEPGAEDAQEGAFENVAPADAAGAAPGEIPEAASEEETTTDAALGAGLEGETLIQAQTLETDLTIPGDAVIENGILDLNGHALTIGGSLFQTGGVLLSGGGSVTVAGDYRIQSRNIQTDAGTGETTVSYGDCGGVLAMHNDADYVKVEGDFYHSGNNYYYDKNGQQVSNVLTAGTLEIGTGLYQTLSGYASFRASGTHRVLLKGSGARTVSFANDDARIAVLETEGTPDISWQGYFRVEKLGSDVAVGTVDEEGITLWSDNGKMDFYGHNLTVTGNVKAIRGKLYIGGASLADDGSGDTPRPQNMGSLTVNGNVTQGEDVVVVDGGAFTVTGDYRIQKKNDQGSFVEGSGVLAMHNDADYVKVEGDFYHSGNNYYYDKNGQQVSNVLTAGTLEIGTGLYQTLSGYASFRASDTHRVLLKGSGARTVSFANDDARIAVLETEGTPDISWQGYFRVEKLGSDVAVGTVDEEGITLWSDNGKMDFYGHNLTVTGNVKAIRGKLYIGGASLAGDGSGDAPRPQNMGSLTVNGNVTQGEDVVVVDGGAFTVTGDYRIQKKNSDGTYGEGSGVLAMHNDADYVKVEGDFYHSGNNYYYDKNGQQVSNVLTAGTLEIGTGLYQTLSGYASFRASGTHRVLLKGSDPITVSFANDDARIAVLETEGTPDISWQGYFRVEKLGSDVAVGTVDEEGITLWSDNGKMDFYGHNLTVTGNVKAIRGKLYIGGASLADDGSGDAPRPQNMGSLTVNGNVTQGEDVVVVDGGAFTVTGDYRIQKKNSDETYGEGSGVLAMHNDADYVKVEGDFYHSGNNYYYDKNGQQVSNVLTAGTLEIGGSFFQTLPGYSSFRASGTHRTVLTGTGIRFVQFANSDQANRFQALDLSQDLSNYLFSRVPCWVTLTQNGEPVGDEAIGAIPYTISLNADGETVTVVSWKDESSQIVIPDTLNGYVVTGIGRDVFRNRMNLERITLPAQLKEIGNDAFNGCSALSQVDFPASLTAIGSNAFRNCTALEAVNFAEGSALTSIGDSAFNYCRVLRRVDLPASLTTLGNNAFRDCQALAAVTFGEGSALKTIGSGAFCNNKPLTAVEIPAGTERIGYEAFLGCEALKKVTLPSSVTEVESRVFRNTALTSAGPAGSGADYEYGWTTAIPAYAFYNIPTLTELTLPDALRTLGRNAVSECVSLSAVTLPPLVDTMGVEVFAGCEKLQQIQIPDGVTSIPEKAFQRCLALEEIGLPSTLTQIGSSAFERCESLAEINLPSSLTQIGNYAFNQCRSLEAVTVPDGVTVLPQRCFINCSSLMEVTLPDTDTLREIQGWAFEGCTSLTVLKIPDGVTTLRELVFKTTPALTQLFVPESVTDFHDTAILETTSADLVMYVKPGSAAEQYAIAHNIPYADSTALGHSVSILVRDPAGQAVKTGFTTSWYDAATGNYLGGGSKLRNVKSGTSVVCSVILGESLGGLYMQPADVSCEMGAEDQTLEVTLAAFEKAEISGTVKDAEGKALPGASVLVKQTYNGTYEKTSQATADTSGAFTLEADRVRTVLTFSASGCYDKTYTVSEADMKDGSVTIDAVLEKIPADRITLSLTRQNAAPEGKAAETVRLTSASGLTFAVHNETTGRDVTDFRVQYPYMTLGEDEASAGDTLRLSLTDRDKTMTAEDKTVTLDAHRCAEVDWTLVQNGSIALTGITSEAVAADGTRPGTAVMVFDAQGRIVESGSAGTSYTTGPLPAGQYTLVLMEKTSMLRGADSLSKLGSLGLTAGTDYANETLQVQNGLITAEDGITVPDFDETKLYYTVEENTRFWANLSTAVTAQYVTMRASYEIDSKYESTDQELVFEIPAGMEFKDTSLTVDGRQVSGSTQEREDGGLTVTVPVGRNKGTVRFYVMPTSSGSKRTYAYLSFKKGSESVMQPIGFTDVEVKAATIQVPSRTGFKTVTASGKTAKDSTITVYDNGKKVGNTTTNANGSWSLEFDLVRPLNYSYHEISAEITNSEVGEIEAAKASILYNANYVQLSKVTMINTAHPANTLRPTEYKTIFDFLHPETSVPTYDYWPSYPTFSFVVEFTGGDPDTLSDVRVITTNSAGDRTSIKCTYDEEDKTWVGTRDYKTFSSVPCRVAVSCVNSSGDVINDGMDVADMTEILTEAGRADNSVETLVNERASTANETFGEDSVSFDVKIGDEKYGEYTATLLDWSSFDLEAWKKGTYVEYKAEDGTISYESADLENDSLTVYTAYPADKTYIKEVIKMTTGASAAGTAAGGGAGFRVPMAGSAVYLPSRQNLTLDGFTDVMTSLYGAAGDIGDLFKDISGIQDVIDTQEYFNSIGANVSTLNYDLGELKNAIIRKNCKCISKEMKDGYWKNAEDIEAQIKEYNDRAYLLSVGSLAANAVMNYCGGKVLKIGGKIAKVGFKKVYKAIMKRYGSKMTRSVRRATFRGAVIISEEAGGYAEDKMEEFTKYLSSLFDVKAVIQDGFTTLRDFIRASVKEMTLYKCPCEKGGKKCECDPVDPDAEEEEEEEPNEHGGGPDGGSGRSVIPKADPSGYVYEAVPSNRVEGVTASLYQYDYAVDEHGVKEDDRSEILWDAERFDQVNPQTTDAAGTFAWDVPEGDWVVKFTKEGYEDADSYGDPAATSEGENGKHYLPVPPIQTEVNTAMVSEAAPEVSSVSAFEDEIRISFSQYMQIDTVNTTNVTVKTVDGTAVAGTIEALNAEKNYEGTTQYASSFAFKPAESAASLSGTVTVTVNNVKNYNGEAIAAAYTSRQTVTVMPKSLEISGSLQVLHHETTDITVKVLPAVAGANRNLTVTAFSPSIVSAQAQTITTDENGTAVISLTGNLPGQGILEIALDGTDLTEELKVTVNAAPTSLEEGDFEVKVEPCVYDGTAKEPAVTIDGLTEGTDFTVTYDNNINAGNTAVATITGIGFYTGTITQNFTISRAPISGATITGLAGKTYNGKAQTQALVVKMNGKTLKAGTDYKLTYKNNINAAAASAAAPPTVTVTGLSNYGGSVAKKFTIAKAKQTLKASPTAIKVAVGKTAVVTVTGSQSKKLTAAPTNKAYATVTATNQTKQQVTVKGVKVGSIKLKITSAANTNYNAATIQVTLNVVPAATAALKAENLATGIKLTWGKVTGATGYYIYRNNKKIKAITKNATVTFTDTAANTNGTKYTYKVTAYATLNKKATESTLSKTLATYRVARPAISSAANTAAKTMTVKWAKNAKATGYQIQYSTSKTFASGNKTVNIAKAATVSQVIKNLTKGKTYYVRIRTYKTAGSKYYSAWSATKAVKITK